MYACVRRILDVGIWRERVIRNTRTSHAHHTLNDRDKFVIYNKEWVELNAKIVCIRIRVDQFINCFFLLCFHPLVPHSLIVRRIKLFPFKISPNNKMCKWMIFSFRDSFDFDDILKMQNMPSKWKLQIR